MQRAAGQRQKTYNAIVLFDARWLCDGENSFMPYIHTFSRNASNTQKMTEVLRKLSLGSRSMDHCATFARVLLIGWHALLVGRLGPAKSVEWGNLQLGFLVMARL